MPELRIGNAFVPNTAADVVLDYFMVSLGSVKGLRLERPAKDTLVIHHRHVPDWAKILGVVGLLFFLLGAVLFLVKTTETATVVGRNVNGGAEFTATGSTSQQAVKVLYPTLGLAPGTAGMPHPGDSPRSANETESAVDEIRRLAELRDRGVLTNDEFAAAKARLLE
jgi:hypothetical protein